MKLINRIKNKVSLWLINKLIKDPVSNCPNWDSCTDLEIGDFDFEPMRDESRD